LWKYSVDSRSIVKGIRGGSGRSGELAGITPGARADVILLEANPIEDIGVFERYESDPRLIVRGGVVVKDTIGS
jgi:imidazolonepropionase-like amidohydrolase